MKALVGYTGFVGSNIYESGDFDCVYNSRNISEAFHTKPDLLVYSGLRAEKYLANHAPEKDMELIVQAIDNIKHINPKKLVLISTIDVFKNPQNVNENTRVDTDNLHAYGYNRYQLECWVRKNHPDSLIVRLPGLFGKNIKKNFIYDFMNRIPAMLKEEKLNELSEDFPELKEYYLRQDNGFCRVRELTLQEKQYLKDKFMELGFCSLNFTDSRSIYQFYPLYRLWNDIQIALQNNIRLFHPATEPISAGELYYYLTEREFKNELPGRPANYDFRTVYEKEYKGKNGYLCDKHTVMEEIRQFVSKEMEQ